MGQVKHLPCNDCGRPPSPCREGDLFCADCYDGAEDAGEQNVHAADEWNEAQVDRETAGQKLLRRREEWAAAREDSADRQRAEWKDEGR